MHRDQKVGLALGVLLIGVVAAFFFRNEPEPGRAAPSLENAAKVDREIAEKRLTPYFSGIETDEPARGTPARTITGAYDQHDHRTGERKLPRWEEALSEPQDDPFAARSPGSSVPSPAPDPIQYEATDPLTAARPPTEQNPTWKPAEDRLSADAAPATEQPAVRLHEVQRGDTLSSIAGKYLGSQARFQDIFAANRDQLQDANDLKVGMKLRIPDPAAKTTSGKSSSPNAGRSKKPPEAQPVLAPPLESTGQFQPTEDASAIAAEEIPAIAEYPPEKTPATPGPTDAPKVKFTPSKRRPARAPANGTP